MNLCGTITLRITAGGTKGVCYHVTERAASSGLRRFEEKRILFLAASLISTIQQRHEQF